MRMIVAIMAAVGLALAFTYGFGAFVEWSANPGDWNPMSRWTIGFFGFVFAGIAAAAAMDLA